MQDFPSLGKKLKSPKWGCTNETNSEKRLRVGGCSKGVNEPHVREAESKTFFVDRRTKKLELKGISRET